MNKDIIDDLYKICAEWHIQKQKRLLLERDFLRYTGLADIVELHVPYTKYEYFFDILDRAKRYKGNKILACAGDNMNLDIFGPFFRLPTSEAVNKASARKELDTLIKLLEMAEKIYDKIIFMQTNHDKRIYKLLYKSIQDKKQAEEVIGYIKPVKQWMEERGLKKIIHVPGILFSIGDTMIAHWENNLTVPGSTSRKIVKGILARLPPTVNVVFQAHTHYQSRMPIFRKLIIETGALSDIFDYARGDKLWGEEKSITIGYAYAELKNGKADWNKCNYHIYELEGFI